MKNAVPRRAGSRSAGKNKKLIPIFSLILLAASCNPLASTPVAGVYKTVNGGSDWRPANTLATTATGSIAGNYISKLAFDPTNSQTVFAGSYSNGLFKSTDSAATWANILSNIEVYDFAVSPQSTSTIYAAGLCVDHGCLLKTTDGGASWNEIYHEGSAGMTPNPVRTIAINPANPNQMVLVTTLGSVVKTSDGGVSWQLVTNYSDQVNRILWQTNVYVLLKDLGLFESPDLNSSSTELTAKFKTPYNALDSDNSSGIGTYHQVYVDTTDPNLIYFTADQGLYKSIDGGKTWQAQTLPIQPGQTPVRAIAVADTSSSIVYASAGGTVYKSLDGGQTWQTQGVVANGFVNYILIDPQLPQISYVGIYINPSNN